MPASAGVKTGAHFAVCLQGLSPAAASGFTQRARVTICAPLSLPAAFLPPPSPGTGALVTPGFPVGNLRLLKALHQVGRCVSSRSSRAGPQSRSFESKVIAVHLLHVCYVGGTSVPRFTIYFKSTKVITAAQLCI